MGLLRSELMKHGTLVLPADNAREYIDLIGAQPQLQMEDMNSGKLIQARPYRRHVQRIDKMEGQLRFLRDEIRELPGWEDEIRGGDVQGFLRREKDYSIKSLEAELDRLVDEFAGQRANLLDLKLQQNETIEELYVARLASAFHGQQSPQAEVGVLRRLSGNLGAQAARQSSAPATSSAAQRSAVPGADQFEAAAHRHRPSLLDHGIAVGPAEAGYPLGGSVGTFAGVCSQACQARFGKAIFRATRGNVFTHFQEIYEPLLDGKTTKQTFKSVFVIYFPNKGTATREKIQRVCDAFGVQLYNWFTHVDAAEAAKAPLRQQLSEQAFLLEQARRLMRQEGRRLIERVSYPDGNSLLEEWRMFCAKEKSIYATLNLFEEGQTSLRTSCWFPEGREDGLRSLLASRSSMSIKEQTASAMLVCDQATPREAPTYFVRNELTGVIQEMVDTYGLPRYQEVNPMPLTIVTFPFLFGIMYGDVGHGLMLLIVGLLLCYYQDRIRKLSKDIHGARYLIAMMGFFATYCGLLYNDFFSIGLELFDSRWESTRSDGSGEYHQKYDITNSGGSGPYPFGIDPAWHGASNELLFVNSLKMKLSVVIGVVHMTAGLLMRCLNAINDGSCLDFLGECIPMLVFTFCFFGFMDVQIVYKWVTPMDDPPSIINSMIAMALGPMGDDRNPMFGAALPPALMFATIFSVLVMLIPKPLILYLRHSKKARGKSADGSGRRTVCSQQWQSPETAAESLLFLAAENGSWARSIDLEEVEEEFDLSEVIMHQVIETIEFALGTVSHTASYLRLWALSLAHNQLSSVFFQDTIGIGLSITFPWNVIVLYFLFVVWLCVTIAILLGMDVMECSLHTLRLHWVEYQSKFYKGDGYPFHPYHHRAILEELEPWSTG